MSLNVGFADPVRDAQGGFRAVLDAMASPGRIVPIAGPEETPAGISPAVLSVLLTLADYTTPLWLGRDDPAISEYLSFHSGAPKAATPDKAVFAWVPIDLRPIDISAFHPGDAEYPDRAATLLVEVASFEDGLAVTLSGPGIEDTVSLSSSSLDAAFWTAMQVNNARYPLGVDVILASADMVVGLPRSISIEV